MPVKTGILSLAVFLKIEVDRQSENSMNYTKNDREDGHSGMPLEWNDGDAFQRQKADRSRCQQKKER
jgi:hypothetical protein